jgi:ATP-dependent Lon protease
LDRITTVETKYLLTNQKIHIATNYLLKDMMKEMKFKENDVTLDTDTMSCLITKYTNEGGVRKLKSLLYNIVRELNLANLMKISLDVGTDKVTFPFLVTGKHLKILLKDKYEVEPDKIHTEDKSGVINGLWANSMGQGGVLSLQTIWLPSQNPLSIKATGNLEKVIKESTEVACSVAWSYLSEEVKTKYMTEWKDKPMGFHIHCPDGATPKDGPSAGCALTLSFYSLLTNRKIRHDIAITGEINLQGDVTAIGGLENKLEGAKKAGIKLAMYPKENEKDIKKIKERNPTLIDNDFQVLSVETFEEAMKHAFI